MPERVELKVETIPGLLDLANEHLEQNIQHCIRKPNNDKWRTVTIVIKVASDYNAESGILTPVVEADVKSSLPGSQTIKVVGVNEKGGFTINQYNLRKPQQGNLPFETNVPDEQGNVTNLNFEEDQENGTG